MVISLILINLRVNYILVILALIKCDPNLVILTYVVTDLN